MPPALQVKLLWVLELLKAYHWTGNLRELHNCLERAAIICNGSLIGPEHLTLE